MSDQFFPSYTIGRNAYDSIVPVCGEFGKTAVIIGGHISREKAEPKIRKAVTGAIAILGSYHYGDDATFENADRLAAIPEVKEADMIFAVGGGRAVDTVKCTAARLGKPVFTFPTLASNCASVTAVCIIYYPDHTYRENWYRNRPAYHTFIDTEIIAESPEEYFWAGIGDAFSKEYEVLFSARGDTLPYVRQIGIELARNCSEGLFAHGEEALRNLRERRVTDALEYVAQNIILSTGLVSNCVPVDYNSNLAHAIYNSYSEIPHEGESLHGAIVCYGTLVLLTLDGQIEERDRLLAFARKVQLPHKLSDIGIQEEQIEALAEAALKKPDVEKAPYPITKDKLVQAMEELEALSDGENG